jgi:hypothetical protein
MQESARVDVYDANRYVLGLDMLWYLRHRSDGGFFAARIKGAESSKLNKMLEQTFMFIRFPELRPIPFAIIERYQQDGERVPEKYLRDLTSFPDVINELPLLARQQIWEMNPKSFEKTVLPLMKEYSAANQDVTASINSPVQNDQRRKKCEPLKQLLTLIGSSETLYATLLQLLRTHHAKKRNPQLCVLRADLVLGLHDKRSQVSVVEM